MGWSVAPSRPAQLSTPCKDYCRGGRRELQRSCGEQEGRDWNSAWLWWFLCHFGGSLAPVTELCASQIWCPIPSFIKCGISWLALTQNNKKCKKKKPVCRRGFSLHKLPHGEDKGPWVALGEVSSQPKKYITVRTNSRWRKKISPGTWWSPHCWRASRCDLDRVRDSLIQAHFPATGQTR